MGDVAWWVKTLRGARRSRGGHVPKSVEPSPDSQMLEGRALAISPERLRRVAANTERRTRREYESSGHQFARMARISCLYHQDLDSGWSKQGDADRRERITVGGKNLHFLKYVGDARTPH